VGDAAFGEPRYGNAIGSYFIELAKRDAERTQLQLPDRDFAYSRGREALRRFTSTRSLGAGLRARQSRQR